MRREFETTQAFVLRKTDYKDSDRILTLYTRDHGKISVSARGARASTKRFSGPLEPFVLLEVTLESPAGQKMRQLMESTLVEAAVGLSQSMPRLSAASFAVELFRESIPEEAPDKGLFDLLLETIRLLGGLDGQAIRKTIAAFQLKLLSLIGIAVSIERCSCCALEVPPRKPAFFHPGQGGVVCTACGGGPILLSSESLSTMAALSFSPLSEASCIALSADAEQQIENAVLAFIEHHLGRPLLTRASFQGTLGWKPGA